MAPPTINLDLFQEIGLEDEAIKTVLEAEGYTLTKRGLVGIRKELGLKRRQSKDEQLLQEPKLESLIREELDKGNIGLYGRQMAHHYFRSQGLLASR
ncbi:MAG: hypothetical protein M1816_004824, partial [Peltula sp. TS41687]